MSTRNSANASVSIPRKMPAIKYTIGMIMRPTARLSSMNTRATSISRKDIRHSQHKDGPERVALYRQGAAWLCGDALTWTSPMTVHSDGDCHDPDTLHDPADTAPSRRAWRALTRSFQPAGAGCRGRREVLRLVRTQHQGGGWQA